MTNNDVKLNTPNPLMPLRPCDDVIAALKHHYGRNTDRAVYDAIDIIEHQRTLLTQARDAIVAIRKDLKHRIDLGSCDGYKEDGCYVLPLGNGVVHQMDMIETALTTYIANHELKQGE